MKNGNNSINGLRMLQTKSKVDLINSIESIDRIGSLIEKDSFVVAYLNDKVIIGKYSDNKFTFLNNEQLDWETIQRIRIFNENGEVMLWKSDGKLIGRHRKDSEGEQTWFVENDQVLFGTKSEDLEDYTRLTEDRGTEVVVPLTGFTLSKENKKEKVKVTTRNYIGYNEIHQATYVDNRLVNIFFESKNKSLEV